MTLPWKVLILSLLVLVVVQAVELEYLIGWVYSLDDQPLSWEQTGGRAGFLEGMQKWSIFLVLVNVAAWAWHLATGAIARAAERDKKGG